MRVTDLAPWNGSRGRDLASRDDLNAVAALQDNFSRALDLLQKLPLSFDSLAAWSQGDVGGFRVDVADTEKEIKVSAELPGVDENDIDVRASEGLLSISGVKSAQQESKGHGYIVREIHFESSSVRYRCRKASMPERRKPPSNAAY